jgi:RNA polymerase sigma-70 factor (ECF subfamily)
MGRLNDLSLATQVAVFHNKRAFDQLVREYQSPVRRFFLSQTMGNESLSDDLAQDTFVKAYTHIGQYHGTASFLTWLTRIAYNVWYDYTRSERAHLDLAEQMADRAGRTADGGTMMDIYNALALLRDDERLCITMQLIDGYAIDEIAQITQKPVNTVKSLLKRGKEKLANYLRQNGYDRS